MTGIRAFIEQIIYISIVAIIIELILPKGNTKKYVYVILSLFILLNIVSPVINIINDIDMQTVFDDVLETISTNTQNVDTISIKEFAAYKNTKVTEDLKNSLSKEIKNKLSSINVKFKDLQIVLNDNYEFEELKVEIGTLDHLNDKKIEKISDIITMIGKEYELDENKVTIIEEGK